MLLATVAEDMTAITTSGTSATTWVLATASSIYEFMIANPLILLFVGITLFGIAVGFIKGFLGKRG